MNLDKEFDFLRHLYPASRIPHPASRILGSRKGLTSLTPYQMTITTKIYFFINLVKEFELLRHLCPASRMPGSRAGLTSLTPTHMTSRIPHPGWG
jgi:hypothetical protein